MGNKGKSKCEVYKSLRKFWETDSSFLVCAWNTAALRHKYFSKLFDRNIKMFPSQHHTVVSWWALCNTQTSVVHCSTKISKGSFFGKQQLVWQQGNRQWEKERERKEQFPGEPAHLMNLFVTGGNDCQHRSQRSFYLLGDTAEQLREGSQARDRKKTHFSILSLSLWS